MRRQPITEFDEGEEQTLAGQIEGLPCVPARARPFLLEQVVGPGAPRGFVLDRNQLVLGRSSDADLRIDSGKISRRHLLLRRSGPEYVAEDLRSSNGVFLNGIKVHSAVLRDGDLLQLGDVVLVYREGR